MRIVQQPTAEQVRETDEKRSVENGKGGAEDGRQHPLLESLPTAVVCD